MPKKTERREIYVTFYFNAESEKRIYDLLNKKRRIRGMSWKSFFLQGVAYLEPDLIDEILKVRVKAGKNLKQAREEWERHEDEQQQ